MPQFDVSTYISQIFWLLLCFSIFWFIMDRLLIPKISEMIEARKRKYDDLIAKAEAINSKALETLRLYDEKLAVAKAKASEQINKNEQELQNYIKDKEKEIDIKLQQKTEESEKKLQEETEEAMGKIEEIVVSASYTIIQQLGIKSVSKEDIQNIAHKGK